MRSVSFPSNLSQKRLSSANQEDTIELGTNGAIDSPDKLLTFDEKTDLSTIARLWGNLRTNFGLPASTVRKKQASVSADGRELWDGKVDFLLSVVGFAVDLSTVWRFPFICYENGGGAFLIPFATALAVVGFPMVYLELALGQYQRTGAITVWERICPMFKGVGFGICIITAIIAMYYNTVISWALYYVVASFTGDNWNLPWTSCNQPWNTNACIPINTLFDKSRLIECAKLNVSNPALDINLNCTNETFYSSAHEYFYNAVVEYDKADGLNDIGGIKFEIALCLLAILTVVYFALWKGVKSSGKVVWVTATFPYVVLIILLCRVVFLDGSYNGIAYYTELKLDKLGDFNVWVAAVGQVLFQLGPGFGVLLALASYNKPKNQCVYDALTVTITSGFTSFISGFVVFATLGYMAQGQGKEMAEIGKEGGQGLVFIAYPEAIATLPGSIVWSVLFFLMLINLGLDTTFGGLESMATALMDYIPSRIYKRREYFILVMLLVIYLGALPTTTYGGIIMIHIFDRYGVEIPLLCIVFIESVAINYFYGTRRFCGDIKKMLGYEPNILFKITWAVVCPIFMAACIVSAINTERNYRYRDYDFPLWVQIFTWCLTLVPLACLPAYAIFRFASESGTFDQRWDAMITPRPRPEDVIDESDCNVMVPSGSRLIVDIGACGLPEAHIIEECRAPLATRDVSFLRAEEANEGPFHMADIN